MKHITGKDNEVNIIFTHFFLAELIWLWYITRKSDKYILSTTTNFISSHNTCYKFWVL